MRMVRPRLLVVGIVASFLLAASASAEAQMRPASAELVRITGRVDVLLKGQSSWASATVGARLVEGDQVRALAGGAADLTLPDGSTILVAENTRFAVAKLDYDGATRDRNASFHVVAGKVRAQVSQAAVQLVRARQSNFNISTPNGVAAVRGTIVVIAHNPATREMLTFVLPSPNQSPAAARVTFVSRQGQSVTITGNHFVRQVAGQPPGSPTPIGTLPAAVQAALLTAENASTAGSNDLLVIQVFIPGAVETQNLVDSSGAGPGGSVGFVGGTIPGGTGACPGCGREQIYNRGNMPQAQVCPRGTFGTPPNCSPGNGEGNGEGTEGTFLGSSTLQAPVCPPGTFGTPPSCTQCASQPCGG